LRVIHIVTNAIFSAPGGLEASVLRIARFLAKPSGSRVIVYTRKQAADYTPHDSARASLEVVHLGQEKPFLLEPVSGDPTESVRLDYLLLVAEVQKRMQSASGARHVLISFFATNTGFLAQQVALTLGIPHVASIRGTDFCRDFRTPHLSHAIQFVVERAQLVVTTNQEQARVLAAAFPAARAIRTIHNAMPEGIAPELWKPTRSTPITLATDCQLSFKKATQILLAGRC
jgi:Glycosyltransferase Family 4